MFKKGKTDLLEIKSIHELPGRIRFHCEALYYIREFNEEILNSLLSTNMIKKASINNITKNITATIILSVSFILFLLFYHCSSSSSSVAFIIFI